MSALHQVIDTLIWGMIICKVLDVCFNFERE